MRVIRTIRSRLVPGQWRQARPLVAAAVIMIVGGFVALGLLSPSEVSTPARTGAGPLYQTAPATPITYVQRMTHDATVMRAPEVYATTRQSGWIRQIVATPGQSVGRGQVLAMLQPADNSASQAQAAYQTTQENLGQARDALSDARATLGARQADVEAQTAAVTSATAALTNAQQARKSAQTNLAAANQEVQQQTTALQQAQNLFRQGAIPQSGLKQAQNAVTRATNSQKQAGVALEESQAEADAAAANLSDAMQALRRAQSAQVAARRAVKDAEANVQQQQQAVNRARAATSVTTLIPMQSPVDGTVDAALVQPGSLVTPSTQVVRITPSGISVAEFAVSDDEASTLRIGTPATVTRPGLRTNLSGRVQGIYPTANGGEARNRVIIEIADPMQVLQQDSHVSVQVPLRQIKAVAVPRTALVLSGTQVSVRVVENGVERSKPVTVAGYEDEVAVISEGLSAGERVVIAAEPLTEPRPLKVP